MFPDSCQSNGDAMQLVLIATNLTLTDSVAHRPVGMDVTIVHVNQILYLVCPVKVERGEPNLGRHHKRHFTYAQKIL
jgi:hypothetical protein